MSEPAHRATLDLARDLIARRSLTPDDDGCVPLIEERLTRAGFTCERLDRGGVRNLWARRGQARPLVCFAGHVDVVPPGPLEQWVSDPFTPTERDGFLYGRGASDMKGPLAAMITAVERFVTAFPDHRGAIGVIVTSDEEGTGADGTVAVVDALRARGEAIDQCVLGEPTSTDKLGDALKNGRRGSLTGTLVVRGVQGHIAYPHLARNPIHEAGVALAELAAMRWDDGDEFFDATSFQIASVHAGTGAHNVIPSTLEAVFNFRFSPVSPEDTLKARVHEVLDRHGVEYSIAWDLSGAPFITRRGPLVDAVMQAITAVTGVHPVLSTGGGTSDGRFLARLVHEIVEFGPSNASIHKANERIALADLAPLSSIYEHVLASLLPSPRP